MKLYKIMKRGGPKELAPLLDFEWSTEEAGGKLLHAGLTFAEKAKTYMYLPEVSEATHGFRIVGDAYELRFESLWDLDEMQVALDDMAARWRGKPNELQDNEPALEALRILAGQCGSVKIRDETKRIIKAFIRARA